MNMFDEKMISCPKCGCLYLKEIPIFGLQEEKDSSGKIIYKSVQPLKEIRCRDCGALIMTVESNVNTEVGFTQDDIIMMTK